ncbi:MAG: HAMP domain-containing histidine kinase [Firmicutes bacterium]|nr:HAMP domain-containing histidine kinase [Bacillota bacterium]
MKKFFQKITRPVKFFFDSVSLRTKILVINESILALALTTFVVCVGVLMRSAVSSRATYVLLMLGVGVLAAVVLIIFLAAGFLVSQLVTRPVRRMAETARNVDRDNLSERAAVGNAHDELAQLARELNRMLDSLQASFDAQDRFVSDASHELRTPIAVIDGYAQMLGRWGKADQQILDEAVAAIVKEAAGMRRMIDSMLYLARTERSVQALNKEQFILDDLLDEVVKDEKMVTGRAFVWMHMEPTVAVGDRELIRQLLRIIVDNALKYSPADKPIAVSCYTDAADKPVIEIADKGPGISKEDMPHLFERFFRTDQAHGHDGGTGLGLAIAKKIADGHGADIVIQSELGAGTRVRVVFQAIEDDGEESDAPAVILRRKDKRKNKRTDKKQERKTKYDAHSQTENEQTE